MLHLDFQDFASRYERRDELRFPKKCLKAYWYSPPANSKQLLPRVFISELLIDQLSLPTQDIIESYLAQVEFPILLKCSRGRFTNLFYS